VTRTRAMRFAIVLLGWSGAAAAQTALPPIARAVDIDEKLGALIHAGGAFTDEHGARVRLADYFDGTHPVVLSLAYFRCPTLCDLVQRGLADALRAVGFAPGTDYRVLTISIDPTDTPAEAARRRRQLLQVLGRPDAEWPFLTTDDTTVRALADDLGYRYAFDPKSGQYAHPAAVFVLTPRARISRYLYGISWAARDVRLALVEAGGGRIGTIADRILMTCYRWDPSTRRYGVLMSAVLRGGSLVIFLIVSTLLTVLWRRDRARLRRGGARP
jgi:protein SCO1